MITTKNSGRKRPAASAPERLSHPVLAGTVLLLLAASLAWGQVDNGPRLAIVADAGAVTLKEGGFGAGPRYAGGIFIRTGHRVGLEIIVERYGVAVEEGTAGLAAGRMVMTTLAVNQEIFVLTHGRFLPYGLVGIGSAVIGYAPDAPAPIEKDFVDRLALQLGGGIDVRLSSRLVLCAKARYNMVKTWVEELPREDPIRDRDPLAEDMLHLYGLEVGLGLKLSF
jgi:hypothetical protein